MAPAAAACSLISSALLLPKSRGALKPLFSLNFTNPSPTISTLTLTLAPWSSKSRFRVAARGDKEHKFVSEGLVTEALPNCLFKIQLENNAEIVGYLSGKMQQRKIMILPGDKVEIEIDRYDPGRARITYRLGKTPRPDATTK